MGAATAATTAVAISRERGRAAARRARVHAHADASSRRSPRAPSPSRRLPRSKNMVKKQPNGKRRAEPSEAEDDAASSLAALTLSDDDPLPPQPDPGIDLKQDDELGPDADEAGFVHG